MTRREYIGQVKQVEAALKAVKTLEGLIPICSSCKKVRGDEGSWGQIEEYISRHSEADFSHGICPDCMKTLYPDYAPKEGEDPAGSPKTT